MHEGQSTVTVLCLSKQARLTQQRLHMPCQAHNPLSQYMYPDGPPNVEYTQELQMLMHASRQQAADQPIIHVKRKFRTLAIASMLPECHPMQLMLNAHTGVS